MFDMRPAAAMAAKMALAVASLMKSRTNYGREQKRERTPGVQADIQHMTARVWQRARKSGDAGRPAWTYRGARRNALKNTRKAGAR